MIELRKITFENIGECIKLEPNEEQKTFVASNIKSLAEAYVALSNNECIPMPYAIYSDNTMVGFIMLSYNKPDDMFKENSYWVWRFMIDKRYQGKGYGRTAFAKALDYIRTFPYGEVSAIFLSYEPENVLAKNLYASFGFVETGDIVEGEMLAKLMLPKMG